MRVLSTVLNRVFGRAEREKEPAYDGPLVAMQSRPDRVGDSYRFAWEHEVTASAAEHTQSHRTSEEFRIEILEVRPDGLKLARTRLASDLGGTDGVGESLAYSHAWIGVPVLFDAESWGAPRRMLNWNEVKAAVLSAVERSAPKEAFKDAKAYLGGVRPEAFAVEDIGSELVALSGVQFRGEVPEGRQDDPPRKVRGGLLHHSVEVTRLDPDRFRMEKLTRIEPDGPNRPSWTARTSAIVAADDGWVIELDSEMVETHPDLGAKEVKTTKARRLAGPETA